MEFVLFIDEPLKYTKIYVGLMTKLLPIFKDIYLPYEEEVKKYGEELVSFLNKKGAEGLREISYSILDASILDNKEVYTILISVFFSYTVSSSYNGGQVYSLGHRDGRSLQKNEGDK